MKSSTDSQNHKAFFIFFLVPFAWGSSFILVKIITLSIPIFWMQFFRVLFAMLILFLLLKKPIIKSFRWSFLWKSGLIGLSYFSALTFQSFGLQYTTASKAGLISGTYVIIVPLLSYLFYKEKITKNMLGAIIFAITGFVIINYDPTLPVQNMLTFNLGDFLIFCAMISISLQIILIERYTKLIHPIIFSLLQSVWTAIFSLILALIVHRETNLVDIPINFWIILVILGIVGTGIPFIVQNWGQKHIKGSNITLILSTTPIFAAVCGILIGQESITWQLIIGGLFILIGNFVIVASEFKQQPSTPVAEGFTETKISQNP